MPAVVASVKKHAELEQFRQAAYDSGYEDALSTIDDPDVMVFRRPATLADGDWQRISRAMIDYWLATAVWPVRS